MLCINQPTKFILAIFAIYLTATVLSIAADSNSTNPGNNSVSNEQKIAATGRDTGASSASSASSACFASDTLVTLANRKRIPIHSLRPGDQLLTTNGLSIFTTQMMMMLDKNSVSQAIFHTIVTASGHNVSLTPLHLIPIVDNDNIPNYVSTKQVKVGDLVYVISDDGMMMPSPVTEVIVETKAGYYAPLTTSGTILANGIMASCYSNVRSHEAAQWYMGVLRGYYWLAQSLSINEPFGNQNAEGLHVVPQIMYEAAQFLYPSALRSS